MSDIGIQIYKNIPEKKPIRSKSHKISKTFLNLKWIKSLRKTAKKNLDKPIFVKKEYTAEEMLENAKIHRQANRPLKKIKEFDGLTKFCQCCYNPMKNQVHVTDFNYCDNTSEFAEFGMGISLYYFYLKYASTIFFFTFFSIALPNIIITKQCTEEIFNICTAIYYRQNDTNKIYPFCDGYVINNKSDTNLYNNQIMILFKFNSMNLKHYQDIYFNITNNNDNITKTLVNYHLIYFIGLFTLFIIHSLCTILLFNITKQYDMSVTSPSDYAAIITNLQSAFRTISFEIKRAKKYLNDNNQNNNSSKDIFINKENESDLAREIYKRFQELGMENLLRENKITTLYGLNEFLKNIICAKQNGEQYKIYLINISYKINEFKSLKEKIKEINNEIYITKNDPEQIQKNKDLSQNEIKYYYHPLDIFNLYICPFTLYEKSLKISEKEKEKHELEEKVKNIMNEMENLSEENFSGVVFVIFNSMKEKDKFLESYNKNLIMTIITSISNLKYYLFYCCINPVKREEYFIKYNLSIEEAPEPEDIIYENLEFSWIQRLLRIILVYIISFILIALCFFFILYLNGVQIKKSQNENNIFNSYGVSFLISISIAIINSIFENLLIILTKMEKQISMTNYFLSYSIKLTILTFLSSAIIPYLSNKYYSEELNLDLLITNCFTMFLSNSFLIPITWTINFDYFLKKLRKYIIKKKNKHLPQNELNTLYELLDMDIASKYSYVTRTLLMSFFYLPIFPLGIIIGFIGFIFSFLLEKYNFIKKYKKPIMLNSRIYEIYSNFFVLNLFMASLGDYLFLEDTFNSKIWLIVNVITFSILFIFPYNNLLSIDLIGINESDIKVEESYEDYFYNFFNDYERNNPITKKEGIKHFLDKLLEKVLITKKDADTILQNYEHMNLLEIYYKSKLHFGYNLLKRAFFHSNLLNKQKKTVLDYYKAKDVRFIKNLVNANDIADKNERDKKKDLEDTKEEPNNINIYKRNKSKVSSSNNEFILDSSLNNQKIFKNKKNKKLKKKIKKNNKVIHKLNLRKDISKPDDDSRRPIKFTKRDTIEKRGDKDVINIFNININKYKMK